MVEVCTSKEELLQFIERIERVNEDIDSLKEDVKNIYSEAKSAGFDAKAIKAIIKIRKTDPNKKRKDKNN